MLRYLAVALAAFLLIWTSIARAGQWFELLADSAYHGLKDVIGVVRLEFPSNSGEFYYCSSVILNPQWIATSAHCIYNFDPEQTGASPSYFTGGIVPVSDVEFLTVPIGKKGYRIEEIIAPETFTQHPSWKFQQTDWAFLKIKGELAAPKGGFPSVDPSEECDDSGQSVVVGFPSAKDDPKVTTKQCQVSAYIRYDLSEIVELAHVDGCLPPAVPGLSGSPYIHIQDDDLRVCGIYTGPGDVKDHGKEPVMVRSDVFHETYEAILNRLSDEEIQSALTTLGHDPGPIDGNHWTRYAARDRSFQTRQ